ncbi:hypothetical protein H0O02_01065 [Candidatus Micrarchaeota archaeon]|nr:hypothetical protein [Candidatus Micrarchaeota archaeon]
MNKQGKAYCFFRSSEEFSKRKFSKANNRIQRALDRMKADPDIKNPIPQSLRLSVHVLGELVQKLSFLTVDGNKTPLTIIAEEWQKKGADYVLRAVQPAATNLEVADNLGYIFNLLYGCTEMPYVDPKGMPVGDVYFRQENGIYVSKL